MNILLWALQVILALHTIIGAVWKFTNSEQTVPALKALPHSVWQVMSGIEVLAGVGMVIPAFAKALGIFAPVSAIYVAAEMLLFAGLSLSSRKSHVGSVIYWLAVAAVCAFIAYGRLVIAPL